MVLIVLIMLVQPLKITFLDALANLIVCEIDPPAHISKEYNIIVLQTFEVLSCLLQDRFDILNSRFVAVLTSGKINIDKEESLCFIFEANSCCAFVSCEPS